jgi:hypothetical protein
MIRVVGDSVAIIALADGLGSQRLSAFGARAAVRGATTISDIALRDLASAQTAEVEQRARAICQAAFTRALAAVHSEMNALRAHDPTILPEDLQSTLQLWVAAPTPNGNLLVAGSQIGDGALFARLAGSFGEAPAGRWRTLLAHRVGETNNDVAPLTDDTLPWWQDAFFCLPDLNADCLMAMTDGIADDLRPPHPTAEFPGPDPYLFVDEFGALALRYARESVSALLDFLGYRKRQSLDDRTIVVFFKEGAE